MQEIDYHNLVELIKNKEDLVLLDARANEYHLWETIPDSVSLRWKYITKQAPKLLLNKKQTIVTFCQSFVCTSSTAAYAALSELGYVNLYEYSGGVEDWRANGGLLKYDPNYKISSTILKLPGQNFYGHKVGSYLIEDQDFIVIVDGPQKLTEENEDFIASFNKPVKIFMTHGSTGGAAEQLKDRLSAQIYLHVADRDNEWLTVKPTNFFNDSFELSDRLQVIHTPGHSPGSACLYDRESGILFSGDHLQGSSKNTVWDFVTYESARGDINLRLKVTKQLLKLQLTAVYPFHYKALTLDPHKAIEIFLANNRGVYDKNSGN